LQQPFDISCAGFLRIDDRLRDFASNATERAAYGADSHRINDPAGSLANAGGAPVPVAN
jgi:hypothetical protein